MDQTLWPMYFISILYFPCYPPLKNYYSLIVLVISQSFFLLDYACLFPQLKLKPFHPGLASARVVWQVSFPDSVHQEGGAWDTTLIPLEGTTVSDKRKYCFLSQEATVLKSQKPGQHLASIPRINIGMERTSSCGRSVQRWMQPTTCCAAGQWIGDLKMLSFACLEARNTFFR